MCEPPMSKYHYKGARSDKDTADERFCIKFFMEKNESQNKGDNDAELVNRNDLGRFADLQRPVVAQPRSTRCKPRKDKEKPAFLLISPIPLCAFVMNTIAHAMTSTTPVLIAVARLELTPSIPTLARIDVSAAKTDESKANTNHIKTPH